MSRIFLSIYLFFITAIVITFIGLSIAADHYIARTYGDQEIELNQEIARGCFYLLSKELTATNKAELNAQLVQLQPKFGYPLTLHTEFDLKFSDQEQLTYDNQEVVVREHGDLVLYRVSGTPFAIGMGPFSELDITPIEATIYFVTAALVIALFVMIATFFFWQRMRILGEAANAFGRGDFSRRTNVSKYSPLASLAKLFNDMADRIEHLITSHKELTNAVSHELRTPIARMRFGLESVRDHASDSQLPHLAGIRNDVNELEDLVSELLGYARFDRMTTHTELTKAPLLPWLKAYVELAREDLNTPITFTNHLLTASLQISFDPRLLERALHNLLQNADRFASNNITLETNIDDNKVRISISDDGPGIDENDRSRIFEAFVRLENSRNKKFGGYGLGLAIVFRIVQCHGGKIWIDQADIGGAKFTMEWPIVQN